MLNFKDFLVTLVVFLGIDAVWLLVVAKSFYDKYLGAFERTVRWGPALLVYLLLVLGIVIFALPKHPGGNAQVFLYGAIFGLISYGVYDLTNWATLAKWPMILVVVDMIWGALLCGSVALISSLIINR